ncbi:D-glycerate dehydrogenase [Desulfuromonas carbonis]|uniref:NAD(P)-dependent oxidoreductase n=1 Tax=Desulfuromonas sp. DDH964 TaxID=1823759 RepID=UPI00078BE153|nr:NAD(P)-dependent oxidoreductase [Desulfuromonas sp. DDH964]AMV73721.1 D-3-phosphoglycerate dehydrogenase [Desulfuromonas sp. DDH964]
MQPTVVITHWVHPEVIDFLASRCRVVPNQSRETLPREEILRRAARAEGLMTFMPDQIDAGFLRACPRLRVIGAALKGYDNIDADACLAAGVKLNIVSDLLTAPTAELAVGLLLALIRQVRSGDSLVRSGGFSGWRPIFYGSGLVGSTVGLVGMGAIGQAIARRLAGFEARLLYADPRPLAGHQAAVLGVERRNLPLLVAECDHLLLSVPLLPQTRRLFDSGLLSRVKPGCYLVNVGRGSVFDEAAVAAALASGRLGGFAADVFAFEDWTLPDRPTAIHPALLALPEKTLFTPHLGSATDMARRAIALDAANSILAGLADAPVAGPA